MHCPLTYLFLIMVCQRPDSFSNFQSHLASNAWFIISMLRTPSPLGFFGWQTIDHLTKWYFFLSLSSCQINPRHGSNKAYKTYTLTTRRTNHDYGVQRWHTTTISCPMHYLSKDNRKINDLIWDFWSKVETMLQSNWINLDTPIALATWHGVLEEKQPNPREPDFEINRWEVKTFKIK